jgi:hypothetical protein
VIIAQLVQQKAKEVVTGLHDSAKIEVVDPELKKSMEDAAKGSGLPGEPEGGASEGADTGE